MAKLSGAKILWECLLRESVEVVFGYPGGQNLPIYDAMLEYPTIKHVLVRHEQNAGHAADGYARASGKVGVALATSGPGATNLVTAIATAMLDSAPVVFITGQVPTKLLGSDAFQETDTTGVTMPITKHNFLVMRTEDLAATIQEAFHLARSGRPGPVLVDLPKDVQNKEIEFVYPERPPQRPGEGWKVPEDPGALDRAVELIHEAKRPIILAGHGVLIANATEELRELAERTETPIAFTLLGLGGIPASHRLALGMMGMHGEAYTNTAIQRSDLVVALGMRFDDRVTGKLETYAKNAKKIHIDIDAAELNKTVPVDVAIHADLRSTLRRLLEKVKPTPHTEWIEAIDAGRQDTARRDIVAMEDDGKLYAAHVIHDLCRATDGDVVLSTDVGQHQMWVAQYFKAKRPRTFIWSGGLGTMGFGLPSAMGAKFARSHVPVWAIVGDGGFQMSIPELATLQQEKCAVKIAIINNGFLGMVRQWQELFYNKRYSATPMLSPDFVKLAEAYEIPGLRVTKRSEVIPAVKKAMDRSGPVLVEFRVEQEDMVWPMVPTGTDLGTMLRRPLPSGK